MARETIEPTASLRPQGELRTSSAESPPTAGNLPKGHQGERLAWYGSLNNSGMGGASLGSFTLQRLAHQTNDGLTGEWLLQEEGTLHESVIPCVLFEITGHINDLHVGQESL